MKCTLVGLFLFGLTVSVHAAEPADRVRPIQIISSVDLPAEVPYNVRPFNGGNGFEVVYLAEGADLIGIESLDVQSIVNREKQDISKQPSGEPSWSLGPFAKTSDDGKFCLFHLKVLRSQFGQVALDQGNRHTVGRLDARRKETRSGEHRRQADSSRSVHHRTQRQVAIRVRRALPK